MKRPRLGPVSCLFGVLWTAEAHAGWTGLEAGDPSPLVLSYPVVDYPFVLRAAKTANGDVADPNVAPDFIGGLAYASMNQSQQIYTGLNQSAAWGISKLPGFESRPMWRTGSQILLLSTYDFLVFASLPPLLGQGWLHEEWHRSVMVTAYTGSSNPFSFMKQEGVTGDGAYPVGSVLDENLAQMKSADSANLARMSAAGGEGQLASVARMQRDDFFRRRRIPQSMNYVLNTLNIVDYLRVCSNKELVTERSLDQIEKEGSNQSFRDAKGFDFTAWAYDLFNPDTPYSDRGLHPYGNGVDRYIYGDKLTDAQYDWIEGQSRLAFLGYFSPMNLFVSGFRLRTLSDGSALRGNFALRYFPTSFGNEVGVEVFLQTTKHNLLFGAYLNQNHEINLPAVEAELFEKPLTIAGTQLLATVHVNAGLQPHEQRFLSSRAAFVGATSTTLHWRATETLTPFLGFGGKTKGWVRGNPFLEESVNIEVGLSSRFE